MPTERLTILVADDSPDNLAILVHALSPTYRVRVAISGERALEMCRSDDRPALVLLDVTLQGMDGHTVCARLKADSATAHIPVIFVTGDTSRSNEDRCVAVGGADCVTKPVGLSLLLRRVQTQVELIDLRARLRR